MRFADILRTEFGAAYSANAQPESRKVVSEEQFNVIV